MLLNNKVSIVQIVIRISPFCRPAFMDEYEKLDEELKKVYEVRLQESERDTYFIEA